MYVHRRRTRVEIWTPAKLNLYLEVLGRRSDGYHEVDTLMVPIGLFDTLWFSCRDDHQIRLTARWTGPQSSAQRAAASVVDELPVDERNLAYRAIELLRRRANIAGRGMNLQLLKRIPIAAGLGGGSSDAAAALWGANLIWGLEWSTPQLVELAAELGSDVPFFLCGTAARCRGRGERVTPVTLSCRPHFVVVRPSQGLSTAAVYAQTRSGSSAQGQRDASLAAGCRHPLDLARALFNRLQHAAEQLAPWLCDLRRQFSQLDVLGHQLSGSGSAYFGICRNAQHAARIAAVLRSRSVGRVFHVTSVVGRPQQVVPVSQY